MALLWLDGFEGFTTNGNRTVLDPVYDFSGATGTGEVFVRAPGRTGGKRIEHSEAGSQIGVPEMIRLPITSPTSEDTWVVGFAHYVDWTATKETELLQFLDSGASAMVTLKLRGGTIHARRGDIDGTILGVADAIVPTKVWHYIECKVRFHDSSGTVEVRVNGETVLNLTGQDTKPGSATSPSLVYICGSNSNMDTWCDDYYILDAAGATHNDFLGDCAIRQLKPNGNGTTNDFVGSDGDSTDNYLLVDDDDPDSDTTYSGSATVGEKDLYALEDVADTPATIHGISVVSFGKKTDAGAKTFVHVVRSGTTESDSSALTPAETYGHQYSFYAQDPDTSAAWTEAGVNAMEAGVKIAS